MRRMITVMALAAAMLLATATAALATPPVDTSPKCADFDHPDAGLTGWDNHATHIIEQYLLGGDFDALDGNPSDELGGGQLDSTIVVNNAGAAGRGHLAGGVPPGASFCP